MLVFSEIGSYLGCIVLLHLEDDSFIDFDLVLADDNAFWPVRVWQLPEPPAVSDLLQPEPCLRVGGQNSFKQVFAVGGKHLGGLVLTSHDLLIEFGSVGILKG